MPPKNRRRKTRKNAMDDVFYYDMDSIVHHIQKGSGHGTRSMKNPAQRNEINRLSNKIIALGWRKEYVTHVFRRADDRLIANWPDTLLIEGILKGLVQQIDVYDSIQHALETIGIVSEIAMSLETILSPLQTTCYTQTQILDIAIEYLLGKYKPIAPINATHLIEPDQVNVWRPHILESKHISIYNIPSQCKKHSATQQLKHALSILPKMAESSFYFHATSWKSSLNIMDGIKRIHGRFCLDFSIFPAFYLSPSSIDSVDWCLKKMKLFHNEVAILVFAIPNVLPPDISIKELENKDWTHVTKQARECQQQDSEIKAICDYDLLYGDMVSNPEYVKKRSQLPRTHTPPKKQLVGRTDAAERFLYKCLVGCVFFQKHMAA